MNGASIKRIMTVLFFVLIAAYALFQARFLILGPSIDLTSPKDGQVVNSVVDVRGTAHNIAYLSLNDRQIFIDKEGNFSEEWIASPGVSIMTLRARDRFNREKETMIHVVVNQ